MTNNKFRTKENPGLSDAFAGMDYEIKPKMIEIWNGKRIAWAIALLSVLVLIPIIYLLYNSYWNESRQQSQMTAENTPQSQLSQLESPTTDSPVVITAPESAAKSDESSSQPVIDNETRARLEQRSLEEVSASIHKPLTEADKASQSSNSKEAETLSSTEKTTTETPKPQSKSIATAAKQELNLQTEQVSSNTSTSSTTASPPPVQASTQQVADNLQSEDVKPTDKAAGEKLNEQQLKSTAEQLSANTNSDTQEVIQQQTNDDINKQQLESQTEQRSTETSSAGADPLLDDKSEHVNRARLVSAVSKLEPVGEDLQSITINNGQSRRIVYFTEVKGLGGQNITYRWLHEGQLVFSKKIAVDGDYSWRSYINKLIPASMPGSWVVELRNDQDIILSQHSFEVLQSLE
ncbi:MAG: DUF2914 domain-containing protein [Methylococcales bacterium]